LGLLATGCGNSDDGNSRTISREEFIQKADSICAKHEKKQKERVATFTKTHPISGPKAEMELVEFAGLPPLLKEAKELAQLPLPNVATAEAEEFIKAIERGVQKVQKDPRSLLVYEDNPLEEAENLAEQFGFKVCGGA
jgi:hypothetical protein